MDTDVPWVTNAADREAHEQRLAAMRGRRLEGVRYVAADEWGLERGAGFDSADFGLELDLDDGTTWSFAWLQKGRNEGVLAVPRGLVGGELRAGGEYEVADVSADKDWRPLVGQSIEAVEAAWQRTEWWSGDERGWTDLCVASWVVHFASDHVVVTLGRREEDGRYSWTHENVAVFFSLADARAHGIPLPGDTPAGE
ncbi:MAG TPA: hypothetical protein VF712_12905 [Thermoleophilaceae bacterium]|jgi:hypothetical protein